jgi:hypothetical protein
MNLSMCVVALAVATQAPQGVAVPGPETVAGPQPAVVAPRPAVMAPAGVCNVCDVSEGPCETGCQAQGECWPRRHGCRCNCSCGGCSCCSTCDMFPHYAYRPVNYGYYYFRPYNWTMIGQHQNIAAAWGLDPTNPYTRVTFEALYAELPRATAVVPIPDVTPAGPSLESLLGQ